MCTKDRCINKARNGKMDVTMSVSVSIQWLEDTCAQKGQLWSNFRIYIKENLCVDLLSFTCFNSDLFRYKIPEKYCLTVLYRCPNLNQIPLTCKLKYNPDDPCCPLPDCPAIIPPTAGPGSTLAPTAQPPPMPGRVPVSTIFLGEMILSNCFFC